jgi:tetratricopeptide (TPR) repeat protein/SAM-dependent methyltransferase
MVASTVDLLEEAARLHRQGAPAEAASRYRQVLQREPAHAVALYHLAVIACQLGQFSDGIELARQSLASDPRQPRAHNMLGMASSRLGRHEEALASFDHAILLQPDFADAHGNRASALMELGRNAEAVASYERTVALQPGSVGDWLNLGTALHRVGREEDALAGYDRALALHPSFPEAHCNRGNVLARLGRHEEALASYERALAGNRSYVDALDGRGQALLALGRSEGALASFEEALALAPDRPGVLGILVDALLSQGSAASRMRALSAITRALAARETDATKALFVQCIKNRSFISDPVGVRALVLRALSEPWDRPADLAVPAASLVKLNPAVKDACARVARAWPDRILLENLSGHLTAIADDELLRAVLETVPVCDVELERLLTAMRAIFLAGAHEGPTAPEEDGLLRFFCALARQCFINEYVFDVNSDEIEGVRRLRERLVRAIGSGGSVPVLWLIAAASFLPLHTLPGVEALLDRPWSPAVAALLTQQVREPLEELRARDFMPRLTAAAGASHEVKQEYEENPSPRWVKTAPAGEPMTMEQFFGSWLEPHPGRPDRIDILVAGCGTGQHLVEMARQFRGAQVLAVDPNRASLCYAKRQSLALGLKNIAFGEADVLALGDIDRTFDIVDAGGALHHMTDPWAGWRVLLALLRPGGFMRVGLSSRLGRSVVKAARGLVAERGYAPTVQEIRRIRQDVLALPDGELARNIVRHVDFFTTGACRDMLFSAGGRQVTLPEIAQFVGENGIEFVGFLADPTVIRQFQARFPQDRAVADLALWHAFEADNPDAFAGMYQFWVRKRG